MSQVNFIPWGTGTYSKLKWAVKHLGYEKTVARILTDSGILVDQKPYIPNHEFRLSDFGEWICVDDCVDVYNFPIRTEDY